MHILQGCEDEDWLRVFPLMCMCVSVSQLSLITRKGKNICVVHILLKH